MIKAHVTSVFVHGGLEADSRTSGDTVDTGMTVAATARAATPIDTVIRVAAYFAFPIASPSSSRNDGHRVRCRASRRKLSFAWGETSSVVDYCNLAGFGAVLPSRDLESAGVARRRSPGAWALWWMRWAEVMP